MHKMGFYKSILRPVFFKTNPEKIHNFSISMGEKLGIVKLLVSTLNSHYRINDERLKSNVCGINFNNPVGLAAGYWKKMASKIFLK